ncbi:hypothetical protein V8D89_006197 [Ganoderma adspersum]
MALLPCEDSIVLEEPKLQKTLRRINPFTHTLDDCYYKPQIDTTVHQLSCVSPADRAVLQGIVSQRIQDICLRKIHSVLLRTWEKMVQFGSGTVLYVALKAFLHIHVKDFGFIGPLWLEEGEVVGGDSAASLENILDDEDEQNFLGIPFAHFNLPSVLFPWRNDEDKDEEPEDIPSPGASDSQTMSASKDIKQIAREQVARKARNRAGHKARLARRFAQIEDHYVTFFDTGVMFPPRIIPNKYDGARLLTALAKEHDARGDVSQGRFEAYIPRLIFAINATYTTFQAEVAALVPPHDPQALADPRRFMLKEKPRVLDRAHAFFACTACGRGLLPYPQIHTHWKDAHTDTSCWDSAEVEPRLRVEFWTPGVELVKGILGAAGLPENVEMPELDRLIQEGRLYCSCGDPIFPTGDSGDIGWGDLVFHVCEHQNWYDHRCQVRPSRVRDESLVLNDDHELDSCIKLLPKDATNVAKEKAKHRIRADGAMRARIEAHLAQCPEGAKPICRLCDLLTLKSKRDVSLSFQVDGGADRIVYHIQAK